jgi:hypothetical protein
VQLEGFLSGPALAAEVEGNDLPQSLKRGQQPAEYTRLEGVLHPAGRTNFSVNGQPAATFVGLTKASTGLR